MEKSYFLNKLSYSQLIMGDTRYDEIAKASLILPRSARPQILRYRTNPAKLKKILEPPNGLQLGK